MKRISFLCLRYLILIGLLSACSRPDFNLVGGDSVRLTDHQGQWIIINYWAEWCKPCLEEVPELNEFYAQVDGKLLFYSISYDKDSNKALAEQKKKYGTAHEINDPDEEKKLSKLSEEDRLNLWIKEVGEDPYVEEAVLLIKDLISTNKVLIGGQGEKEFAVN